MKAIKAHLLVMYYPDGKTLQALGTDPTVTSRGIMEATAEDLEFIDPSLVTFDKPVHFFSPEGNPTLVQPGTYTAESFSSGIKLIPNTDGQGPLFIEGEYGTHDTGIEAQLALSLPGGIIQAVDVHEVMLLLPTGQSIEAIGSYSGIQERGFWNKKRKSKRIKKRRNFIKSLGRHYKKNQKDACIQKSESGGLSRLAKQLKKVQE